jgi:hypothetical protein
MDSGQKKRPIIYVDEIKTWIPKKELRWGTNWCHMWCDGDVEDLHKFAIGLGLKIEYFQNKRLPHYDLIPSKRILAIKKGAKEMSLRDWIYQKRRPE